MTQTTLPHFNDMLKWVKKELSKTEKGDQLRLNNFRDLVIKTAAQVHALELIYQDLSEAP